jgi:hypothetical protein
MPVRLPAVLLTSLYAVALTIAVLNPGQHLAAALLVAVGLAHRLARHSRQLRTAHPAPAAVDPLLALPRP